MPNPHTFTGDPKQWAKDTLLMICTIALNVELSYKECGWQTPFKWTKRSVGFPYPFSGICRTRMYDKFRPRYSADVH